MIVKRNFNPIKVWGYVKTPMTIGACWATVVYLLIFIFDQKSFALNFTPVGVLGSALAIFVAFRNNSAYARWWEARGLWGGVVNGGRVFARLIVTLTDSHAHQPNYEKERSEAFKKAMIYRTIAWAHALRFHLREQKDDGTFARFLSADELNVVQFAQNKPNYLQLLIGRALYKAMADGTLGGFDGFQLEGQLLALANAQSGCEKIKHTPLPRQYDYFTRVFIYLFLFILPLGTASFFLNEKQVALGWVTIPLSILLGGVFVIMERTGAANEHPFENKITDVPLGALCLTLERDLRETLGETDLPPAPIPIDGYLF